MELILKKIEYLYRSNKIDNNSNMEDIILIYLKNKEKMTVISTISKLSNIPYVVYAEPDYLYELDIIPNDPDFEYLCGIPNINAPLAWNYTTGTKQVVIGVLDSGIDVNHPDLRGNLWFNGPFFNGWNFVNNNPHPTDVTGHGTHVAGVAALLKSYMPFLTTFQTKNIILLSSTKSPFLTDKFLTGGILNVDSMIKLANFLFLL